jgi:hypothetical protein
MLKIDGYVQEEIKMMLISGTSSLTKDIFDVNIVLYNGLGLGTRECGGSRRNVQK